MLLSVINWGTVLTTVVMSFISAAGAWILAFAIFKTRVQAKFEQYDKLFMDFERRLDVMKGETDEKIKFIHDRITKKDADLRSIMKESIEANESQHEGISDSIADVAKVLQEVSSKVAYMAGKLDNHIENGK